MSDNWLLAMLGAVIGLAIGLLLAIFAVSIERNDWRSTMIDRDLAQYCPKNGEWAWKDECK